MILVSGGTGLVGSFIIRDLLKKGESVRALYRESSSFGLVEDIKSQVDWFNADVLDIDRLEESFHGIDAVIHAAAVVSFDPKMKEKILKVNIEGTANMVNLSLIFGVQKFIHISSVAAIGGLNKSTVDETEMWESNDSHTTYGESKYRSELEVWRGVEEGLHAIIINPSVVLGVASYDKSSSQIFTYARDKGNKAIDCSLNIVDVRDVAKATVLFLKSDILNKRFILSKGKITYMNLFSKVRGYLGLSVPTKLISKRQLYWVSWLDRIWSLVTFSTQKLPMEAVRSLTKENLYVGDLVTNTIDFKYTSIEDTIKWCCGSLVDKKG